MRKYFYYFAAIAALASCAKENPVNENPISEPQEVTIQAVAPSTKTQLVDGTDVQWTPGDKIKMCFDVKAWQNSCSWTGVEFENSGEVVSESASFTGDVDLSKINVQDYGFVVYPTTFKFESKTGSYSANYTTTISHVLPSVQPAVDNTFASDLNLSYAPVTKKQVTNNISYKNPIEVTFQNMCALIKVTLPTDNYNVKEILVESASKGLTGEYSMLWEAASNKQTLTLNSFKSEVKEVTIANEDGRNLTPGASYYAVVWPGQHSGLTFTFTDDKGLECVKDLSKAVNCEVGKITEINVKTLEFKEAEPELTVNSSSMTFVAGGAEKTFSFNTNKNWTITSDQTWLTLSETSGVASKEDISITATCAENTAYTSRTANITISAGGLTRTIKVTQEAAKKVVSLAVSTDNISISGQGGTASFTVTCNDNWTITNIPDWLRLSQTSGTESASAVTVNVTVKQNLFYTSNDKSITIKSNSDNTVVKYIRITQKGVASFTIGEAVGKAGDMQNGQVYIIRNNSNQNYYWRALSGNLVYNTWTDGAMSITYAFIYHRDDSKGKSSDGRYTSVSTGAWQSCHTGNYLASDFKVNVNSSSAVYVANSNRWDDPTDKSAADTGNDIDMCQIGSTYSIAWNGSKYLWGSTSEGNRKWLVYKAVPQY